MKLTNPNYCATIIQIEKIVELELLETYKANALVVVNLINKLPSNITVADKELLDECFDAYEKLIDEVGGLTEAMNKLHELMNEKKNQEVGSDK